MSLLRPKASPEKKRKILSIVFEGFLLKDKMVTPVYNKAFKFIAERVETINIEDDTLELENSSNKAVILETDIKSDDLLGVCDSNLLGHQELRSVSVSPAVSMPNYF